MSKHNTHLGEMESRLRGLRVSDVMARSVVTVREDAPLNEAAEMMFGKGISGAPVINAQGTCVGMISAVDFMRRQRQAWEDDDSAEQEVVGQLMSRGARTVRPDSTLLDAARMMCDAHIHRLPVTESNGQIVGILTSLDVVAALVNAEDETHQ